jgi:YVTN family beta-propeller protein
VIPFRLWTAVWVLSASILWGSPAFYQSKDLRLYVGNSMGNDVSIIDLPSLNVIGYVTVGEHVHGVAVQRDGRRLFTTSETDHTLIMSDTVTYKIIATVKLPGEPNQCAVTPDGRYVAVSIRDRDSVAIVNVALRSSKYCPKRSHTTPLIDEAATLS